MTNQNLFLNIKVKTWSDDTFELVEYQNYNYSSETFTVKESGTLTKKTNKNKICFQTANEKISKKNTELFKITKNSEDFIIGVGKTSTDLKILEDSDPAYLVFKGNKLDIENFLDNKKKLYKLNQGDIIKMGRIFLKILDIVINKNDNESINDTLSEKSFSKKIGENTIVNSAFINGQKVIKGTLNMSSNKNKTSALLPKINNPNENLNKKNDSESDSISNLILPDSSIKSKNANSDKKKVCRICYCGDEKEENNPLLCPCICKGSMKYIHYKCLKNWLNSKIESNNFTQNPISISYIREELKCELCKTKFPDFVKYKNELLNLTLYDNTKFKQYIIFESLRVGGDKKKSIHILSLDNNYSQFTLGRANECDIVFEELSVSRYHCLIFRDHNKIYIQDNNSKFGTLALIQNPNLVMLHKQPLRLQKSKTYIKIKLDLPFNFFFCCNANILEQKSQMSSYEIQNKKFLDKKNCFVIKENKDIENDEENNISNVLLNSNNKCKDLKFILGPFRNRRKSNVEIEKYLKNLSKRNSNRKLSRLAEISNSMFMIGDNFQQDERKKKRASSIRMKKDKENK